MKNKKILIISLISLVVVLIGVVTGFVLSYNGNQTEKNSVADNKNGKINQKSSKSPVGAGDKSTPSQKISSGTIEEPVEITDLEPQTKDMKIVPLPGKVSDFIEINCKEDIEKLKGYDSVKYLKINSADLADFKFLGDVKIELLQILKNEADVDLGFVDPIYLQQLYLYNTEIKNTDVLSKFDNLQWVYLVKDRKGAFKRDDLSFLGLVSNLKYLDIRNYTIENLNFIKDMPELETLKVQNSLVSDLSPIKDMKKLTSLSIDGSLVSDLTPVKYCSKLTTLEVVSSRVKDLSALRNTNIDVLNLKNNYIEDISTISRELKSTLNVDLSENYISDISSIKFDGSIYSINLSRNYITSIPEVGSNSEIWIDLSHNNISKISEDNLETIKKSANSFFVIYDNLLDESTLRRLSEYENVQIPPVYSDEYAFEISDEESIKFTNRMHEIIAACNKGDDFEKVLRASEYVASETKMDFTLENPFKDSSYGALFERAVCTGMTDLTNALCRHMGIRVKSYHGDINSDTDDSRHVWSYVCINGKYYHCDPLQSKVKLDENGIPLIALLSDNDVKTYGHILDDFHLYASNESISVERRNELSEKIAKDLS